MSIRGGLLAIHPYDIHRHWYLHELRRVRSQMRLNAGRDPQKEKKEIQAMLAKLRKEHYHAN